MGNAKERLTELNLTQHEGRESLKKLFAEKEEKRSGLKEFFSDDSEKIKTESKVMKTKLNSK